MKAEAFEKAVTAFQQSIELDPTFEMSFYGLGRAHLALKQFVSATSALSRAAISMSRKSDGNSAVNRKRNATGKTGSPRWTR